MSRGFTSSVIILGVVFFIAVAAVTFYLGNFSVPQPQKTEVAKITPKSSPTPIPTDETANPDSIGANWKTYTDPANTFTLKYPSNWENPKIYLQSTRTEFLFAPSNLSIIVGSNYDQNLGRPRTYEEEITSNEKTASNKKKVIVSGINTYEYIHKIGESTTELTVILVGPKGIIYWISIPFPATTDPIIFDQILSTFKFLDKQRGIPLGPESEEFFDQTLERMQKMATPSAPMEELKQ